jgi:hypothetical protein
MILPQFVLGRTIRLTPFEFIYACVSSGLFLHLLLTERGKRNDS